MSRPGPLPQWEVIDWGGPYEAVDGDGTVWRLWHVEQPPPGDPHPPGWRLAPRGTPDVEYIPGDGGLYHALDMAGLRIAADAVRRDPDGARRQLGLDSKED